MVTLSVILLLLTSLPVKSFNINNLPLSLNNDRNSSSMGRRDHIFKLFTGKDVNSSKITLSVTMLSSLGNRDTQNLARLSLDHHESSLFYLSSFHRNGSGCTGISGLNRIIIVTHLV